MRSGIWILATCGVVGLALSVGTAQERRLEENPFSFGRSASKRNVEYFSPNGKTEATPGSSVESEADKALFDRIRAGAGRSERLAPSRYTRRAETYGPRRASKLSTPARAKNFHQELFGTVRPATQTPSNPRTNQRPIPDSQLMPVGHSEPAGSDSGKPIRRLPISTGTEPPLSQPPNSSSLSRTAEKGVPHFPPSRSPGGSATDTANPDSEPAESDKQSATNSSINRLTELHGLRTGGSARTSKSKLSTSTKSLQTGSAGADTPIVHLEWLKRSNVNVGQECDFDLVVRNIGKANATDVKVDAYFPPSVRLTSARPEPKEQADHLSWEFATLAPGEEQTIQIRLIPSQRGELSTAASVSFTADSTALFNVEEPLLKVAIKGPKEVMLGDPASQIVTVSNPGTGVATNVTIEAVVPKGLEHLRGERLVMEIGSLSPGESRMVRLALSAIGGGKHTLKIEANADATLAQNIERKILVIAPSIKVAIDGPSLRYIGRKAGYRLAVTNDGAAASNNVRVVHHVPDGFKFVSADRGGKFDRVNNTVSWFVGRLEPGQSTDLKLELTAVKLGTYAHHTAVISEQGARSETKFETHIAGTASLVLEIVDLDDPVEVGSETAYEVRVRNEGSKAAQNVGLSCEIPNAVELVGARGPADYVAENGLIVFKSLSSLQPGKTAIYRVQVRGKVEGNHRFRARLASDSIQEPLIFEELTKFYRD